MDCASAFTVNNDLTYKLADSNTKKDIIYNAVIAISMEKFLSLKKHIPAEYSKLIKMYPNSVSPKVELEKKKLHNYNKTDKELVINTVCTQLCILNKHKNMFELAMQSAFYLIDKNNLDQRLKIKYNDHLDVLVNVNDYIKYDMLMTFCKIDATQGKMNFKQSGVGILQSEMDEIDQMNMSQLINAREASDKRSYHLALDESIFTNIETFEHSVYYSSYVIYRIKYLEDTSIPDLD
jgi:hypothetical protein